MSEDPRSTQVPTRRDYVKYGGAVVGGGLFAGCRGGESTPTAPDTGTRAAGTGTETPADGSYTVSMAPAGEVTFDAVPEDVFTILTHHAGMALALGRGDALNAMHAPEYYQSLWRKFTHHLDGVTVDWEGLYSSWPPTKEKLFELDSDVHLADPAKVDSAEGWTTEDVREVDEQVAPFIGNTFSDTHSTPPDAWADAYEYYTLWEIFERVAAVFRERRRYEALAEVHTELVDGIERELPAESDRPSVAQVLFSTRNDDIWGYSINAPGYYAAHTRPLAATDALAEAGTTAGDDTTIDYEVLLEADPDVLLVLGPMTSYHDISEIRSTLESDPVASDITAVQRDRVYAQGTRNQGPILNLFQVEMTAKQLYPDVFGEWPGYRNGQPYPEIPPAERLFDRQRVADIVTVDRRS